MQESQGEDPRDTAEVRVLRKTDVHPGRRSEEASKAVATTQEGQGRDSGLATQDVGRLASGVESDRETQVVRLHRRSGGDSDRGRTQFRRDGKSGVDSTGSEVLWKGLPWKCRGEPRRWDGTTLTNRPLETLGAELGIGRATVGSWSSRSSAQPEQVSHRGPGSGNTYFRDGYTPKSFPEDLSHRGYTDEPRWSTCHPSSGRFSSLHGTCVRNRPTHRCSRLPRVDYESSGRAVPCLFDLPRPGDPEENG